MRFDVNLSILFTEVPFLERFARAREAGFDSVEFWWPRGEDPAAVAAAVKDADLDVVGMNFDAGDMPGGDRGLISDPDRKDEFRANVPVALELADAIGAKALNALAGHWKDGLDPEEQLELARENVRFAADAAKEQGAKVLIEAVNTIENGPYLFARTPETLEFISSVERDNVAFQFDFYHLQRMQGNLVATFEEVIDQVAHVQIADSPGRNQPGTGELNFDYIFERIEASSYNGFVGLEYKAPDGDTEASLNWLPREQRAARGQS
ncbi:MAG: TIM barrel protein [Actinomycetota bacterium]|nr:TIM barrel protein [Actinomycetota bacterium]